MRYSELPGQKPSHDCKTNAGDDGDGCKSAERQHHNFVAAAAAILFAILHSA